MKVNLLKTETSWATRASIAGWKQAVDLDISAVPPSEAADNFLMHRSYNGSPPTCRDEKRTSSKSRTGPLPTRSSSGSIGIGEPRGTALSIQPEVCSPHKQVGKHANKVNATFHVFTKARPAEKVPLHDWDVLWFRIPLGAWQWKPEAPAPKWETLSKARFWMAMGNTHPEHGSSMDLGCLRARLAS